MTRSLRTELLLAVMLIASIVAARLIPHIPNFSPVLAMALLSGYLFSRRQLQLSVPLVGVVISDLVLGTYGVTMYVVWFCYVLIAIGAARFLRQLSLLRSIGGAIAAAVVFFVVTNVAVWAEGMLYARTWQGLLDCYVAALPFFRMSLVSTVVYMVLFYGVLRWYESTRIAVRLKGEVWS